MAVERPSLELALLAAVLGTLAPATLGKLARRLFPPATLEIRALTDAALGLILATRISHDSAGPVLHFLRKLQSSEPLNKQKNVFGGTLKFVINILIAFKVVRFIVPVII